LAFALLVWNCTRRCHLAILDAVWVCSRRSPDHLPIELDQLIQSLESGTGAGHFLHHLRHDLWDGSFGKGHKYPTPYRTKSSGKHISLVVRVCVRHLSFPLSYSGP